MPRATACRVQMRSALDRAQISLSFMSHPASFIDRPRPAARPRAEAGCAELSQRGLGGSAARRRRWRLPGAGEPVHGAGRTGLDLWRGRGGEIRRRPSRARAQRRVFADAGEAVTSSRQRQAVIARHDRAIQYASDIAIQSTAVCCDTGSPAFAGDDTDAGRDCALRLQRLQKPHRLARSTASSPRPATSRACRARRCRPASR